MCVSVRVSVCECCECVSEYVCVSMWVCVRVSVALEYGDSNVYCTCGGQSKTLLIFYFLWLHWLEKGSDSNLKLAILTRMTSQWALNLPCPPILRWQVQSHAPAFYVGARDLNSSAVTHGAVSPALVSWGFCLFGFLFVCFWVPFLCVWAHATVYMWSSEESLQELVLLSYHMDPGDSGFQASVANAFTLWAILTTLAFVFLRQSQ